MRAGLLRTSAALAALLALAGVDSAAVAQNRRWREVSRRPLVKFDGNCATASAYPAKRLGWLVRAVMKRHYPERDEHSGSAFAFDLNGDRRTEYFVPLVCGATGNCDWGVFALNPARLLGVVNGQYVYVHTSAGRWPDIITYGHTTAAEGNVDTYVFRGGRYADTPDTYRVGTMEWSQIWDAPLHKMPSFLESARAACEVD